MKTSKEKVKQSVESELLAATGEKPQRDGEERQKYLKRLVNKANTLNEKVWKVLSEKAQTWVNDGIENANGRKDVPELPGKAKKNDEDEDEEKPAKKTIKGKADPDEDDEESGDDDSEEDEDSDSDDEDDEDSEDDSEDDDDSDSDDEESGDDEDDEESGDDAEDDDDSEDDSDSDDEESGDEEEEEKPKKKTSAKASKPDKAPEKTSKGKPGGLDFLRRMVCKHPDWKRDKVREFVASKGYEVGENTANVAYYDIHQTLKMLEDLGKLKDAA